jgi:CubicO group peptidase (beta-lactamase class C family)
LSFASRPPKIVRGAEAGGSRDHARWTFGSAIACVAAGPAQMKIRIVAVSLVLVVGAIAGVATRPDKTLRVVTGLAAHTLCSETFVSGFDPDEVYAQTIAPYPGVNRLAPLLRYEVDRARREVRVDLLGALGARAVFRDGLGCALVAGDGSLEPGRARRTPATAPLPPDIAGPNVVEPASADLRAALDHAFVEPSAPPHRWVKAVVVVKDGRVVAERYAPGVRVDTPLLGYSASKSIINALVGVLVREGRLRIDAPAPVAAWSAAGDPRGKITLDNLLRMTSGLAIAQTGSGFDPAARMLYTEPDMAAFAESAPLQEPPGAAMRYSDASALIVSRIVRDAAGGSGEDAQTFAEQELFAPLGMTSVVMETDAAGTPVGSTHILASARDWARLGLLYLDDGVIGGRRVLPEGWVRYSATSTLGTSYGAGFWTNAGGDAPALGRIRAGMPCDAFFASGNLGQRVYIMPSDNLVIVRMGVTQQPDFDIAGDLRLIREARAAFGPGPSPACAARN